MTTTYQDIPLDAIRVSQTSAQTARRAGFDKAALDELAASISVDGVLQAIVVRRLRAGVDTPKGEPAEYELVAGERRLIAAGRAGLERIPAAVRELTDEQVVRVQLVENLQKENLHPMHEAESYETLMDTHGVSIEQLIAEVGKSKAYIYGRRKLLALSQKCRKAFYAGEINASIAEKLARIPVQKTQDEALTEITRNDWSYRRAAELIRDHYMMKLAEAPFRKDVDLAGAGPCGPCLKRTGNQPELFGDIKRADVCTDTACYAAKVRAHGQQLVQAARDRGQTVLTGKAAEKVVPNGISDKHTYVDGGYVRLDAEEYVGGKQRKISTLVPKDAPRTLVVDGESGRAIEVVDRALLPKEARGGSDYNARSGMSRSAEKKKAFESKVRIATYAAVRPKLKPPSLIEIAGSLFRRLEHDATKILCKVRGFEPPSRTEKYRGKVVDYAAVGKGLEKMPDAELQLFINDCIYVRELMYGDSTYRDVGIPKIADLAKKLRVDVAKIRTELAPKKTAKASKTPKKRKSA